MKTDIAKQNPVPASEGFADGFRQVADDYCEKVFEHMISLHEQLDAETVKWTAYLAENGVENTSLRATLDKDGHCCIYMTGKAYFEREYKDSLWAVVSFFTHPNNNPSVSRLDLYQPDGKQQEVSQGSGCNSNFQNDKALHDYLGSSPIDYEFTV